MMSGGAPAVLAGAFVRCAVGVDGMEVLCDRHGVISRHVKSYRLALQKAAAHNCELTADELDRIDYERRQEWRDEDKEWR